MKALMMITALMSSMAFASVPVQRKVPVDNLFVPFGFDSNDVTEVIVSGYLPNLCHKSPEVKMNNKDGKIKLEVYSYYYDESNPFCPEMIVPFTKTVKLGVLKQGIHKIFVNETSPSNNIKSFIEIARPENTAMDNHVYAAVSFVEMEEGNDTVQLRGYNPNDCFVLDRIEWVDNGVDTYSVLPIVKQVGTECTTKMTPFSYSFIVPKKLKKDKVLLHVRSMDGNSFNTVFER